MLENGQKAEKQGSRKIGIALLLQIVSLLIVKYGSVNPLKYCLGFLNLKIFFPINISLFHTKIKQRGGAKNGLQYGGQRKGGLWGGL